MEEARELLLKHLYLQGGDGLGISDGRVYNACLDAIMEALTIPVVVKRYRVEAIAINKKHLFDKEIDGLENASEVLQDLKIKYLDTYISVKMTEL